MYVNNLLLQKSKEIIVSKKKLSFIFNILSIFSCGLLLSACGDGGDSEVATPVVELEEKYQLLQGQETSISAKVTYMGELKSINWRQLDGPQLNLSNINSLTIQLNPDIFSNTEFATLQLELIDEQGVSSTNDTILVLSEVLPEKVELVSVPASPIEETGVEILQGQDTKGNIINVVTYDSQELTDPTINEGVDLGLPEEYEQITNKFIDIQYVEEIEEKLEVRITPSDEFDVIWLYSEIEKSVQRIPFSVDEEGTIKLRVKPEQGRILFSLLKINDSKE